MDLLQKYSAAELFYELDETFIIQIEESLTVKQSGDLIVDIELLVPKLKKVNHKSQLFPSNITQYLDDAAKQLAGGYYGGVPVVYLTPTKEKALAGELFGCEYDF